MKRASGVLLPVFSLPSAYGIGCFSKEAYDFVDALKRAGQTYWQILPLGPTGYGDSPYQSFSTFAGNPYFIDLEDLIRRGYLTKELCDSVDFGDDEEYVDYDKQKENRLMLLRKAYENSNIAKDAEFAAFVKENAAWVEDYALYMALKVYFEDACWTDWKKDIKLRQPKAMAKYKKLLAEEILFYEFQQYLFFAQWNRLKAYANSQGVKIVGDIPIYVAFDSADAWAEPKLFQFDENGYPTAVAGCPPDAFSETGQLWGNPLYDWEYHKETGYAWWLSRLAACFSMYDVVRIDHFRAFDEYYAIPYGDPTAEFGTWKPGPGYALFDAMKKKLGKKDVIAEDLGFLTPSVLALVKKTGYPGMKILQFAFDSGTENVYLPHHYIKNCVVYTGTHDNDTTLGWYDSLGRKTKTFLKKYINCKGAGKDKVRRELIRLAFASVADLCIIPAQDYLALGAAARINIPSTLGTNWKWRMKKDAVTEEIISDLYEMTAMYSRLK